MCYFSIFSESTECDIIEFMHTVEVPTVACRSPYCQYKYCVISDTVKEFMLSPYEFIMGYTTKPGHIIDRLLSLHVQLIRKGGK